MAVTRKMEAVRKYIRTGFIGFNVVMLPGVRYVVSRVCSSHPVPTMKKVVQARAQKNDMVLYV